MASESVMETPSREEEVGNRIREGIRAQETAASALGITIDQLDQLQTNRWVCDYETHRCLWEAQAILRIVSDRLTDNNADDAALFAVEGAERILCGIISRTGWSPTNGAAKEA